MFFLHYSRCWLLLLVLSSALIRAVSTERRGLIVVPTMTSVPIEELLVHILTVMREPPHSFSNITLLLHPSSTLASSGEGFNNNLPPNIQQKYQLHLVHNVSQLLPSSSSSFAYMISVVFGEDMIPFLPSSAETGFYVCMASSPSLLLPLDKPDLQLPLLLSYNVILVTSDDTMLAFSKNMLAFIPKGNDNLFLHPSITILTLNKVKIKTVRSLFRKEIGNELIGIAAAYQRHPLHKRMLNDQSLLERSSYMAVLVDNRVSTMLNYCGN